MPLQTPQDKLYNKLNFRSSKKSVNKRYYCFNKSCSTNSSRTIASRTKRISATTTPAISYDLANHRTIGTGNVTSSSHNLQSHVFLPSRKGRSCDYWFQSLPPVFANRRGSASCTRFRGWNLPQPRKETWRFRRKPLEFDHTLTWTENNM